MRTKSVAGLVFFKSTLRFSERIYDNHGKIFFPSRHYTCVDYGWDRDMWVVVCGLLQIPLVKHIK